MKPNPNLKQPNIVPVNDGGVELYELVDTWSYEWEHDGRWYRIIVAAGFRYDGASIPRWLWSLAGISPDGLHRAAALVHDYIYRHSGALPEGCLRVWVDGKWRELHHVCSRLEADRMFGRLLRERGVEPRRRWKMVKAVRWFGWLSWRVAKLKSIV